MNVDDHGSIQSINMIMIDLITPSDQASQQEAATVEESMMLAGLYLCASTIDGASFQQRLKAASAGGYAGIGLRPGHYKAAGMTG